MSDPCYRVIGDLEVHPSRLNKEAIILAQAEFGNDEFFFGCRTALDPMITFGLKQIKEKTDEDGPGLSWDMFVIYITGFINRSVTGNAARNSIDKMMKQATKQEWNGWYRRILIKDLRCGISEKTINKVVAKKYKKYAIPIFGCQLAHDSNGHESKVTGKKLIEVKLDGVRVITVVYPDGCVDQFSRNGKELSNFTQIKDQLKRVASSFKEPIVLDGEVMSSSFQDLMKQVHRKSNVQSDDAILNLFDVLPLADFEKGRCATPQEFRSKWLQEWVKVHELKLPNIASVGQELVDLDTDDGRKQFKEINQKAIDGGFEGIMIKDPESIYETKRTTSWLKLKPFIEVSLEVVDVEEGTGRNVGKLGALVARGVDDGRTIQVNIGSGFSDADRDEFWINRADIIGHVVEVRADAITQNQDGSYSLRFPRFICFRGFEPGEKI
jgi:DNA ligase-1